MWNRKPRPDNEDDLAANTLDNANMMAMDQLVDSTTRLLDHTKNLHSHIRSDKERLDIALESGFRANDVMGQGRNFIKAISDDPTGIGIMKIALVTFVSLCVLYFGGKGIFKLLFRK
ncbi:hypothetical protein TVAG_499310 [Trichomonas vaginalis G3]|uniref:t-SNARE coiled-coil homology domain-containing protein n=1 Tax=Trichomonas vaginalis (strain ATCC PRA-98 / G3) TaxID=412133 RepID=A2G1F8_TRIV3|nr:hypothetical protein TVAGG3_0930360 [Trichomonas vaginalis G3]EAX89015.1 hypothetical protein TVAG_499310 [Trichomonas vaginalis G3]KAI5485791.1 hypothetical protein TVAGG3_0930360 [Trichomonas vaginalis G3]|eukprot:XP_001301945.1 hypothetical protein [Trichomonas vaginalis G3]